jgi:hypothetical protein
MTLRGCCIVAALVAFVPMRADAALAKAERSVLSQYVGALQAGRYDAAFTLLSRDEQRYFGSAANYASVFAADRLKIDAFSIVASKTDRLGTVALVSERIEFFDQAHQSPGRVTAKVAYGARSRPRISPATRTACACSCENYRSTPAVWKWSRRFRTAPTAPSRCSPMAARPCATNPGRATRRSFRGFRALRIKRCTRACASRQAASIRA